MSKTRKFKGYDWTELAEHWGVKVERSKVAQELGWDFPERYKKTIYVNNKAVIFDLDDEEEILAQKLRDHIWAEFTSDENNSVTDDIREFLRALAVESRKIDYNWPVYEALASIECDHTLISWFCDNLERMWT